MTGFTDFKTIHIYAYRHKTSRLWPHYLHIYVNRQTNIFFFLGNYVIGQIKKFWSWLQEAGKNTGGSIEGPISRYCKGEQKRKDGIAMYLRVGGQGEQILCRENFSMTLNERSAEMLTNSKQ